MKTFIRLIVFVTGVLFCCSSFAQQINKAEYFFDSDPGVGNGTAIAVPSPADSVDITGSASTVGLGAGFHKLFIRARYTTGKWSLYEGRNFFIFAPAAFTQYLITNAEYFVDTDPGVGNGTTIATGAPADSIDISASFSVNGLPGGFHNLFVRVKDVNGIWSLYEGRNFYIIPAATVSQLQIASAEYFIDTDPGVGNGTSISTGATADSVDILSNINTTGLSKGFHDLFVRVKNVSGVWSLYEGRNFFIDTVITSTTVLITDAEYFFDIDPGQGNGLSVSPSFTAADSIDITSSASAAGLPLGSHSLFVRVRDQLGRWSEAAADTFNIGVIGIHELSGNFGIHILPNPGKGSFVVLYSVASPNSELLIKDVTGKIIFRRILAGMEGTERIDLSDLSNGIYYCGIISDDRVSSESKLVMLK